MTDITVSVTDPDNVMGAPAYDGDVWSAHKSLAPGIYGATFNSGTPDEFVGFVHISERGVGIMRMTALCCDCYESAWGMEPDMDHPNFHPGTCGHCHKSGIIVFDDSTDDDDRV